MKTLFVVIPLLILANVSAQMKGECSWGFGAGTMQFTHHGNANGGELELAMFKIRYDLGVFWGEPLMAFRPHYTVGKKLVLRNRNGRSMTFIRSYRSKPWLIQASSLNSLHGRIEVPAKIFDKIELYSYRARLQLSRSVSFSEIDLNNEGLLGRSGEWGWDIAGSPAWSKVFVDQDEAAAKELWKRCMRSQSTYKLLPKLEVQKIEVDLSSFRDALLKVQPDAFDFEYRYPRDRQGRALLDAMTSSLRRGDGKLGRRQRITDKFFAHFGGRMDPGLRQEWSELKRAIKNKSQLSRQIDRLGSDAAGRRAAEQLLRAEAIRKGLVPRSVSLELQRSLGRIDGREGSRTGEFYAVVDRIRKVKVTQRTPRLVLLTTGKKKKRSRPRKRSYYTTTRLVDRTVGGSGVVALRYSMDPAIDPAAAGQFPRQILSGSQHDRLMRWVKSEGTARFFSSRDAAERYVASRSLKRIHLTPPSLD